MTAPAPDRVRELVAEYRDEIPEERRNAPPVSRWITLHTAISPFEEVLAAAEALSDAQDRIAELEAERDRLRDLLRDFVNAAAAGAVPTPHLDDTWNKARAALREQEGS